MNHETDPSMPLMTNGRVENLPLSARSVLISVNPSSGSSDRGDVIRELEKQISGIGLCPEVLTNLEQVRRRTIELQSKNELKTVIAAGGDGTVSRLVNELPSLTPLTLFPLGTENLLAKYLGQTADPVALARLLQTGRLVQLDGARANGKLFLIMASCGFDADVVRRLHADRRGHIRHWSYAKPILQAIGKYPYPLIEMWPDDQIEPILGRWGFAFNIPRYAMNLPIVTDADPTDGALELCAFREGNLLRGLYYLVSVLLRRHRRSRETSFCRFRKLRLIVRDGQQVPYQLDGDPGGYLPLEIVVEPKCFRVVASQAWIDQNGIGS